MPKRSPRISARRKSLAYSITSVRPRTRRFSIAMDATEARTSTESALGSDDDNDGSSYDGKASIEAATAMERNVRQSFLRTSLSCDAPPTTTESYNVALPAIQRPLTWISMLPPLLSPPLPTLPPIYARSTKKAPRRRDSSSPTFASSVAKKAPSCAEPPKKPAQRRQSTSPICASALVKKSPASSNAEHPKKPPPSNVEHQKTPPTSNVVESPKKPSASNAEPPKKLPRRRQSTSPTFASAFVKIAPCTGRTEASESEMHRKPMPKSKRAVAEPCNDAVAEPGPAIARDSRESIQSRYKIEEAALLATMKPLAIRCERLPEMILRSHSSSPAAVVRSDCTLPPNACDSDVAMEPLFMSLSQDDHVEMSACVSHAEPMQSSPQRVLQTSSPSCSAGDLSEVPAMEPLCMSLSQDDNVELNAGVLDAQPMQSSPRPLLQPPPNGAAGDLSDAQAFDNESGLLLVDSPPLAASSPCAEPAPVAEQDEDGVDALEIDASFELMDSVENDVQIDKPTKPAAATDIVAVTSVKTPQNINTTEHSAVPVPNVTDVAEPIVRLADEQTADILCDHRHGERSPSVNQHSEKFGVMTITDDSELNFEESDNENADDETATTMPETTMDATTSARDAPTQAPEQTIDNAEQQPPQLAANPIDVGHDGISSTGLNESSNDVVMERRNEVDGVFDSVFIDVCNGRISPKTPEQQTTDCGQGDTDPLAMDISPTVQTPRTNRGPNSTPTPAVPVVPPIETCTPIVIDQADPQSIAAPTSQTIMPDVRIIHQGYTTTAANDTGPAVMTFDLMDLVDQTSSYQTQQHEPNSCHGAPGQLYDGAAVDPASQPQHGLPHFATLFDPPQQHHQHHAYKYSQYGNASMVQADAYDDPSRLPDMPNLFGPDLYPRRITPISPIPSSSIIDLIPDLVNLGSKAAPEPIILTQPVANYTISATTSDDQQTDGSANLVYQLMPAEYTIYASQCVSADDGHVAYVARPGDTVADVYNRALDEVMCDTNNNNNGHRTSNAGPPPPPRRDADGDPVMPTLQREEDSFRCDTVTPLFGECGRGVLAHELRVKFNISSKVPKVKLERLESKGGGRGRGRPPKKPAKKAAAKPPPVPPAAKPPPVPPVAKPPPVPPVAKPPPVKPKVVRKQRETNAWNRIKTQNGIGYFSTDEDEADVFEDKDSGDEWNPKNRIALFESDEPQSAALPPKRKRTRQIAKGRPSKVKQTSSQSTDRVQTKHAKKTVVVEAKVDADADDDADDAPVYCVQPVQPATSATPQHEPGALRVIFSRVKGGKDMEKARTELRKNSTKMLAPPDTQQQESDEHNRRNSTQSLDSFQATIQNEEFFIPSDIEDNCVEMVNYMDGTDERIIQRNDDILMNSSATAVVATTPPPPQDLSPQSRQPNHTHHAPSQNQATVTTAPHLIVLRQPDGCGPIQGILNSGSVRNSRLTEKWVLDLSNRTGAVPDEMDFSTNSSVASDALDLSNRNGAVPDEMDLTNSSVANDALDPFNLAGAVPDEMDLPTNSSVANDAPTMPFAQLPQRQRNGCENGSALVAVAASSSMTEVGGVLPVLPPAATAAATFATEPLQLTAERSVPARSIIRRPQNTALPTATIFIDLCDNDSSDSDSRSNDGCHMRTFKQRDGESMPSKTTAKEVQNNSNHPSSEIPETNPDTEPEPPTMMPPPALKKRRVMSPIYDWESNEDSTTKRPMPSATNGTATTGGFLPPTRTIAPMPTEKNVAAITDGFVPPMRTIANDTMPSAENAIVAPVAKSVAAPLVDVSTSDMVMDDEIVDLENGSDDDIISIYAPSIGSPSPDADNPDASRESRLCPPITARHLSTGNKDHQRKRTPTKWGPALGNVKQRLGPIGSVTERRNSIAALPAQFTQPPPPLPPHLASQATNAETTLSNGSNVAAPQLHPNQPAIKPLALFGHPCLKFLRGQCRHQNTAHLCIYKHTLPTIESVAARLQTSGAAEIPDQLLHLYMFTVEFPIAFERYFALFCDRVGALRMRALLDEMVAHCCKNGRPLLLRHIVEVIQKRFAEPAVETVRSVMRLSTAAMSATMAAGGCAADAAMQQVFDANVALMLYTTGTAGGEPFLVELMALARISADGKFRFAVRVVEDIVKVALRTRTPNWVTLLERIVQADPEMSGRMEPERWGKFMALHRELNSR